MTVIAYRDGVIAAERRITFEDKSDGAWVLDNEPKLFRFFIGTRREAILGLAGSSGPGVEYMKWFAKGSRGDAPDATGAEILVLNRDGIHVVEGASCHLTPVQGPFYAVGCGACPALAAFYMGATAVQAVEIACKLNPYCGGQIDSMQIGTLSAQRRVSALARRSPPR